MRLWPRRRSSLQKKPASERTELEHRLQDERVDVKFVTIDELGDTTASLTLKEIIRAKRELAGKGKS